MKDYKVKIGATTMKMRSTSEETALKAAYFCLFERRMENKLDGIYGDTKWSDFNRKEQYILIKNNYGEGLETSVEETKPFKRKIT